MLALLFVLAAAGTTPEPDPPFEDVTEESADEGTPADGTPAAEEEAEETEAEPLRGPGPVMTALASGSAACLAMGGVLCAHLPFAAVFGFLSCCPVVGIPWGAWAVVGVPLVMGEAGALAAQWVAGRYGLRRVPNLKVALAAAAVTGAGVAVLMLVSAVFTGLVGFTGFMGAAAPALLDLARIVMVVLGVAWLVMTLSGWGVTLVGAASAAGLAAAYTGRERWQDEPVFNRDAWSVPEPGETPDP